MPLSQCTVLLLAILPHVLSAPNLGVDGPSNDPDVSHLDADDPDFSGVVDFSNAVPGPGGSWCITKMKYVEHMVKDQVLFRVNEIKILNKQLYPSNGNKFH